MLDLGRPGLANVTLAAHAVGSRVLRSAGAYQMFRA